MKLYHIVAFAENRVIGQDNDIPWSNREDLRRFAEITRRHPVIMGRKTFDSLGKYAPLPSRTNIVLSRADSVFFDGRKIAYDGNIEIPSEKSHTKTVFCQSLEAALDVCSGSNEVYVIGGATLYEQTLSEVDELRTTQIHMTLEEDDTTVFYPEIDPDVWQVSFKEIHDTHTYVDYVRRNING